jgi:ATP-dependent RNA helicase CshB
VFKLTFKDYDFKPFIHKAIEDLNFIQPTKIQEAIIPLILAGKSVVGQAVTGSGKTHSFMLPIFEMMKDSEKMAQVVITSPTRELAKQLYDVATHINRFRPDPFSIKFYVGGRDREKELAWLENNQPDIVIGTPGRVWDLAIKERKLKIHGVKQLIIDEADMTLDSGFLEEVDNLAGVMPEELQMCVFSATIPSKLQPFLKKYLSNPEIVDLTKGEPTPARLTHYLLRTKHRSKEQLLLKIIGALNPYLAIIFTNTKKDAIEVANFLRNENLQVGEIHGDLTSRERARMMRDIRDLRYTYIVATDIAARGIDISGVSHIINFSLPTDYEFYIHRSGRTSRQNTTGMVISLYEREDNEYLNNLEAKQITFSYVDVKNNEIVEAKERNYRRKFVETVKTNQSPIRKPKPTKVKPGYKKKAKRK